MPKILIVEDDKFLRDLLSARLRKEEDLEVFVAEDGEEGLRKIKEEKPDLVLLDLIMPGIDGFEVLKKVKEDEEIKNIKIIVLSNLGQEEEIKKALDLGAEDYLIKAHFTLEEILSKIRSHL